MRRYTRVLIITRLLRLSGYLMCNKSLCRSHESYSTIERLQFGYVACIPAHIGLNSKAQNDLSLIRAAMKLVTILSTGCVLSL